MISATVVIPTHHRPHLLRRVLDGLAAQKALPTMDLPVSCEVIVVADGLPRESWPTIDIPFPLQFLGQTQQGAGAARNRGVAAAQGEIILFLDDDVVPGPYWLAEHLAVHTQQEGAVAVIGPMWSPCDLELQAWVAWEQAQLAAKYARMVAGRLLPNPHQFYTGNASLRRALFLQIGGFDETLHRSEDVELAYRLAKVGATFCFASQAGGYHYAERSYATWLAIPYTYGRNSVLLAKEKGHQAYLREVLTGYHYHHPWIHKLLLNCLDRPVTSMSTLFFLKQTALLAHRLRWTRLSQLAFSAIYNLRRYQGMADGLGGRHAFFASVAATRP